MYRDLRNDGNTGTLQKSPGIPQLRSHREQTVRAGMGLCVAEGGGLQEMNGGRSISKQGGDLG